MDKVMTGLLVGALAAAPWTAVPAIAQPTAIVQSDTMQMSFPVLSPDNRWIVFVHQVSNQETRLMIRERSGGEPRVLFKEAGMHNAPRFTPRGDRLVFVSTLPRRGPTDDRSYLVMAPFDTRSGTFAAAPRQVSLDGVRSNFRLQHAISPDGQWLAYVTCCAEGALKVVPITGGNPRTVASTSASGMYQIPGWVVWSADSRFLTYHMREETQSVRWHVSRDGGTPTVVARFDGFMGPPTPDNRHFVAIEGRVKPSLVLFTSDGKEVRRVSVPRLVGLSYSADGRYLVGVSDNSEATIKIVPVAGGSPRAVGRGGYYEWVDGWSENGRLVHISSVEGDRQVLRFTDLDGKVTRTTPLPVDDNVIGIQDGHLLYRKGTSGGRATIHALNLADGSSREIVRDVVNRVCCETLGAGGMYYGIIGGEFYYRKVMGDRLQFHAMSLGNGSRVLLDLPRSALGRSGLAVAGDRLAWTEPAGDSVRIKVRMGSRPPRTLVTFHNAARLGEFSWSVDGRQLAMYVNETPQRFIVYRFDDSGAVSGAPQTFTLPFEYFYETFWLPDGSGMTMIAQPRGSAVTEVALVRFADPERPILLTREDPVSKWGHALSPDGKYVAYPSESRKGSSIHMIDLASLLKAETSKQ